MVHTDFPGVPPFLWFLAPFFCMQHVLSASECSSRAPPDHAVVHPEQATNTWECKVDTDESVPTRLLLPLGGSSWAARGLAVCLGRSRQQAATATVLLAFQTSWFHLSPDSQSVQAEEQANRCQRTLRLKTEKAIELSFSFSTE